MLIIMPTGMKLRILEMRGLPIVVLMKIVHHYGGIIGPAHPYGEKYLSVVTTRERKERKYSKNGNRKLIEQFDFIEIFNACESPESNRKAAKAGTEVRLPRIRRQRRPQAGLYREGMGGSAGYHPQ